MSIMNNEVIVLRAKSLQNNYLKRNYKYTHNEDLAANVPALIKQTVGVEVRFLRIHRNGVYHKISESIEMEFIIKNLIVQYQSQKNLMFSH